MEKKVFKSGSTTYYWSSRFFPSSVRADVFKLYSFVRVADNFVDQTPADKDSFYELKNAWQNNTASENPVIRQVVQNMHYLTDKYDFDTKWVEAFLSAMKHDLEPKKFEELNDSLKYVYGSAEVVGYMMAKILQLDPDAMEAASLQGRAMQWINFIRDIEEDNNLGRCYFPAKELKKYGLVDLTRETAEANPESYKKFVRMQIKRYEQWQSEAETGYKFIPKRLLIPVKTASDMYNFTAQKIKYEPFIVFHKKVKPPKSLIIKTVFSNAFSRSI